MQSLQRIIALVIKEFLLILKEPRSRFVIIGPPLVQFFVFSYAATFDLENVRYAVFDESHSVLSRQLLAGVEGSGRFKLTGYLTGTEELTDYINNEKARIVIHIGPGFAEKLLSFSPATVQVIADGRNPIVALTALGYLATIVDDFNVQLLRQGSAATGSPGLRLVERSWFNGNLRSRWFIVSALGGIISMVVVSRCSLLVPCPLSRNHQCPGCGAALFYRQHCRSRSSGFIAVNHDAAGSPRCLSLYSTSDHPFRDGHAG